MGNLTPRNTLEYLIQKSNTLLATLGSAPVLRTPSVVIISASSGNTNSGVKGVCLLVQSNDATVGGISIPNGTSIDFNATGSDTIDSIAYNAGAGTIIITYLT